jgi:hypothetical protein
MASERRQEVVKRAFYWTPRERFPSASTVRGDLGERLLVSRIVDSLLFSGGAQPSNQEIHRHEYEGNQQLGTLAT